MIKLLIIVPSYPNLSGVDYHRLMNVHKHIGNVYKKECEVSLINEIDSATIDFLKDFDLVICNRFISRVNVSIAIVKLNAANVPYVLDLDDDYKLPEWHILYEIAKENNHSAMIKESIKGAAAITVTHELMANTLKVECNQYNSFVVPNFIDPKIEQYQVNKTKSDVLRFGWSGSITHFEDLYDTYNSLYSLYKSKHTDSFKIIYGGYSKDDEHSKAIASVLCCKGNASPHNFATYPSASINEYAKFYDNIDISLIPLRQNRFNNLKSNLKLIESGFKKCAVIVSDVFPYSPHLKHGINCLKVKNKHDWYRNMVKLIENPNMVKDLAEQLYIDVQDQHIDIVAAHRFQAYKKILNDRKNIN